MARLIHVVTVPETLHFLKGQIGFMKSVGFEVGVVSSPGELLLPFAESEQVPAYPVTLSRRITPLRDLISLLKLVLLFRKLRPAIVHSHTPKGGLLGMMAAFLAAVPIRIYHIHGLPYVTATGFRRKLLMWTEAISCRLASRVLCVAESAKAIAIADGIVTPAKVRVLEHGSINGVDALDQFNPERSVTQEEQASIRSLGLPSEGTVLGFVGRIVVDKGILELAEAWKKLREEFPDLSLILAGPVELQDPVPDETLDSLRADSRVKMTGWIDDVGFVYRKIHLLVLPTYREGLPVTVLEAAAMMIPVVATRVPGCIDAVVDGVTGTLVPPRDASALAAAIRKYLRNPELLRAQGSASRDHVLRNFRPGAIWRALHQDYLVLMQERNLPVPDGVAANFSEGGKA